MSRIHIPNLRPEIDGTPLPGTQLPTLPEAVDAAAVWIDHGEITDDDGPTGHWHAWPDRPDFVPAYGDLSLNTGAAGLAWYSHQAGLVLDDAPGTERAASRARPCPTHHPVPPTHLGGPRLRCLPRDRRHRPGLLRRTRRDRDRDGRGSARLRPLRRRPAKTGRDRWKGRRLDRDRRDAGRRRDRRRPHRRGPTAGPPRSPGRGRPLRRHDPGRRTARGRRQITLAGAGTRDDRDGGGHRGRRSRARTRRRRIRPVPPGPRHRGTPIRRGREPSRPRYRPHPHGPR
jgi:hypothetical protein